jgi:hypothetical protein
MQRRGPSVREHSIQKVSSGKSDRTRGRGETEGAGDIDQGEARCLRGTRFHQNEWTSREEAKTKNSGYSATPGRTRPVQRVSSIHTNFERADGRCWNRARVILMISSPRSW